MLERLPAVIMVVASHVGAKRCRMMLFPTLNQRLIPRLLLQAVAMVNMEWPPCKRKAVGSTPTTGSNNAVTCNYDSILVRLE